jgi:hypothetical protein
MRFCALAFELCRRDYEQCWSWPQISWSCQRSDRRGFGARVWGKGPTPEAQQTSMLFIMLSTSFQKLEKFCNLWSLPPVLLLPLNDVRQRWKSNCIELWQMLCRWSRNVVASSGWEQPLYNVVTMNSKAFTDQSVIKRPNTDLQTKSFLILLHDYSC